MESSDQTRGFTLIELMIVVAVIGVLAAIAIPTFLKHQARSKRAEVKVQLRSIFTAQKAFFLATDRYSNLAAELGFSPERGNRYTYFIGPAPLEPRATVDAPSCETCGGVSVDVYRYPAYSVLPTTPVADLTPGLVALTVGVGGACPACEFLAMGLSNIDSDAALDVWTISSESRVVQDAKVSSGEPGLEVDDLDL